MGGGSGAGTFLKLLASNFDVLAGPVVSLVYPLYASVRAIETKSPVDDQQWLTYWVLYSMITLFELTFAKLIEWIPLWHYIKLIFTCWLVIPYFCGAAYVYEHYVRPYLVTRQKSVNIWLIEKPRLRAATTHSMTTTTGTRMTGTTDRGRVWCFTCLVHGLPSKTWHSSIGPCRLCGSYVVVDWKISFLLS
ncbi:hypothetical protein F511_42305 [Dorcoceras hygrometricum]|uniref:HVA22-like protein n=1 Tax=Dorcoceras hygrometricum TaxID=472368 RepID=A0A2Z7A6S7_9LAMI|nr:hypothetical protein F511_42305 [Dorcoceras hygrometricum]